ncbi:hypothetical protein Y1Q_0012144 [Alligator mississippiensis]|uniref:Uncharacterized protein n=1 Tax=Alligator mississippiensis TaxID=8496 RepID=A0A151MHV7_ALLMI|nr:hypothetical protein Y1Q_0012144 [Alligator mississippiensis]
MGCQTEPLPMTDASTQTKVGQCQKRPGQGERSRCPSQRMDAGTQASLPLTREASTQAEGPRHADTCTQTGALCLAEDASVGDSASLSMPPPAASRHCGSGGLATIKAGSAMPN